MTAGEAEAEAAAADEGAARAAFVYLEALRGLLQQQSAIQSLQARAATLIFAASFASSLLGSQALAARSRLVERVPSPDGELAAPERQARSLRPAPTSRTL